MSRLMVYAVIVAISLNSCVLAADKWTVSSPDGSVAVSVQLANEGRLCYEVTCHDKTIVASSALGIVRKDERFVDGLTFVSAGRTKASDETYTMLRGKRRICRDRANEQTLTFKNDNGAQVQLILRSYDDGVAFRYRFGGRSSRTYTVTQEVTEFALPRDGRVWMHPYDEATEYTPAYETYYLDGASVGVTSPNKAGWAFPVLFCTGERDRWGLLTEAGLDASYCGCRLEQKAPDGVYRLRFPDKGEGNRTGEVQPSWTVPWTTPWRVVMVAKSLSKIVESTLVTSLNPPSIVRDTSWMKPGRASWSWLSDHDSPQDFEKLRTFVDLAAEMGWEYSLVDANWTVMKNGTIHDLIKYATSRGVGLLLWYNSGGVHNYVSEKPRGLMFSRQIRRKEFKLLQQWGVKGVKVDFFQSDKQNIIQLYHDILKDAADFKIMVNFHGCTLPRGWSRTYPHLMSMEAVRGAECYSFDRAFTAKAPTHNTTVPFTRNVVGPMDYTPVLFVDNVYPHLTSYAHELALAIVFESGWLHFADGVSGYLDLPKAPKDFLRNVPVAWDETRCLAGAPGQFAVLARRSGTQWYVGGINGERAPRSVKIILDFVDEGSYEMTMLDDGNGPRSFSSRTRSIRGGDAVTVRMDEYGGFAAILSPAR